MNMNICILIIFVILIFFFNYSCNNREEQFQFPPSMIRAHDGYNAPGAFVDTGFETDIADYEQGE